MALNQATFDFFKTVLLAEGKATLIWETLNLPWGKGRYYAIGLNDKGGISAFVDVVAEDGEHCPFLNLEPGELERVLTEVSYTFSRENAAEAQRLLAA